MPKSKPEKLGHYICYLMREKNLRTKQLANLSAVPLPILLNMILNHKLPPKMAYVESIARVLGCTKGEIFRVAKTALSDPPPAGKNVAREPYEHGQNTTVKRITKKIDPEKIIINGKINWNEIAAAFKKQVSSKQKYNWTKLLPSIQKMFESGLPLIKIAANLHINEKTLRYYFAGFGILKQLRSIQQDNMHKKILELLEAGESIELIAKKLGYTPDWIMTIVRKNKIPIGKARRPQP